MKNATISALRQGMNLRLLLGIVAIVVVIGASLAETFVQLFRTPQLQPSGYHLISMQNALYSDSIPPFVAIVAILPFSGVYIDEVKSKFARISMLRTDYSCYLLSHITACFLLGGAVILVGVLTAYVFCTLIFLPIEKIASNDVNQLPEFVKQCLLLFLNGGFWAVLGMTMSTIMESKYIAYASPFVVYYLLVMLCERYFPNAYLLYPREWLNPSEKWPMGTLGVAIFLLELTALLGLIFYRKGKRRLEQL